jgi:hypothetical protein
VRHAGVHGTTDSPVAGAAGNHHHHAGKRRRTRVRSMVSFADSHRTLPVECQSSNTVCD